MINLEIDGMKTRVPEGTTVLEAANGLGIHIPTLCYHKALSMYASCRVCIVEMSIEKRGKLRNWVDASCVYQVEEGLIVKTNSTRVQKERKLIIALLLSRAPDSPVLNDLARKYGAQKERFQTIDSGESNCILCGLCVRVCNELIQAGAIGTAFRGIHKKVVTPYLIAKDLCIGCGACAYVCPTGAINVVTGKEKLRVENWHAELEMKLCKQCGNPIGPKIHIDKVREKVDLRGDLYDLCPNCRRKIYRNFTGAGGAEIS
ncbi:MAG: 2Fe-2S iron-sulfur cluster-binding protein [Spirochaetota bacterium]